ncbi:hypothetical protein NL676_029246 [Syzygium grande]|nr:hypothetical protein NL676_029246 [Syzygium grande]
MSTLSKYGIELNVVTNREEGWGEGRNETSATKGGGAVSDEMVPGLRQRGPYEEEVRKDGHGMVGVEAKPPGKGEAEGRDNRDIVEVTDVADVLDAQLEFGARVSNGVGLTLD